MVNGVLYSSRGFKLPEREKICWIEIITWSEIQDFLFKIWNILLTKKAIGIIKYYDDKRAVSSMGPIIRSGIYVSIIVISFLLLMMFNGDALLRTFNGRNWVKTPCRITTSGVADYTVERSKYYKLNISYTYEIDGKAYTGNCYDFAWTDSKYSSNIESLVSKYPPGKKTFCYVNPGDSNESVLNKELSRNLTGGVIVAVFFFLGILAVILEIILFIISLTRPVDLSEINF